MPNLEHVRKLKEGARAWNAWRHENPRIEPQLADLELPLALREFASTQSEPINLCQADLCAAALEHATLLAADLSGAFLVQANLAHARLGGANLRRANLSNACLDQADLKDALLDGAILCGAQLETVHHLTQAQLDKTYGDANARLPPGLVMPGGWRKGKKARSTALTRHLAARSNDAKSDAHAVLGVSHKASLQDIRAAYLALVKELHPDGRELDPIASEHLKAINQAYQDLKARDRQVPPRPHPAQAHGLRPGTAFVAAFLGSSLSLLAVAGGLYYARLTAMLDRSHLEAAPGDASSPSANATRAAPTIDAAARATEDDAAWLEATREGTSASLHRYLGRYSNGRHAREAAAALPAVVATEIALDGASDGRAGVVPEASQASLRHYLEVYPGGRLALEVERKLKDMAAAEAARIADAAAWAEAEQTGTAEAIRLYLARYPSGENADYAVKVLAAIEASEARRRADRTAWTAAQDGGKDGLRRYLAAYPDGDNVAFARRALAAIEAGEARQEADGAAWAQATDDGSKAGLARYLAAFPDGEHADFAKAAIAAIEASEARRRADHGAWAKAQQEASKEALQRYLAAYPDGDYATLAQQALLAIGAREERQRLQRLGPRSHPAGKDDRKVSQAFRAGPLDAPASQKWQSADDPFIGADGRMRQR